MAARPAETEDVLAFALREALPAGAQRLLELRHPTTFEEPEAPPRLEQFGVDVGERPLDGCVLCRLRNRVGEGHHGAVGGARATARAGAAEVGKLARGL